VPSLTDELEPYAVLYRAVLAALNDVAFADLPLPLRQFVLTSHERAVLQALEGLLAGRYEALQPQDLAAGLAPPSVASLAQYRQHALASPHVLRCSLLLHDVAKHRGLEGPHPENCARVAERLLAHCDQFSSAEKLQIVWLVRYHDVLGNIYCGERAPAFLGEMCQGLAAAEVTRRLQLLQVVMLCDLGGTWSGRLLTEEKARFWLDLSGPEQILRRQADLLAWRLRRWSGTVAGVDNAAAERALREALFREADPAERGRVEAAFGARISYIVYGFYLFTALAPGQLATLLRLLSRAVDRLPPGPVSLVFETIYRPPALLTTEQERRAAEEALHHYTAQLQEQRLALRPEIRPGDAYCVLVR
jgi:hypothetical protein